jgi:hypothetical protein
MKWEIGKVGLSIVRRSHYRALWLPDLYPLRSIRVELPRSIRRAVKETDSTTLLQPTRTHSGPVANLWTSPDSGEVHSPTRSVDDRRLSSVGLPYCGSGIVRRIPPITSPALKSLFGLLTCPL